MAAWISIQKESQILTANGTSTGFITIGDIRNFHVGAHVWLKDNDTNPARYVITEIAYTTAPAGTLRLRSAPNTDGLGPQLNAISYGHSDVSAYTTAQAAVVHIPKQIVRVEPDYQKRFLKT